MAKGRAEGNPHEFAPARGGYGGLDYEFGPKEVEAAIRAARTYGREDMPGSLGPVSVALLRQHGYAHLVAPAAAPLAGVKDTAPQEGQETTT